MRGKTPERTLQDAHGLLQAVGIFLLAGGTVSLLLSLAENPILRGVLIAAGIFTGFIQRLGGIQPWWAGTLLSFGILLYGFHRRWMFLPAGVLMITAGLVNMVGGKFAGWTILGIPQILIGLIITSIYWDYAPEKFITSLPSDHQPEPKKPLIPIFTPRNAGTGTLRSWKTMRVFISSTFRDMGAERDQLVRFIFPRLREELLKQHIHLVDVDLRWGVTSDQDVLEICQKIIDECRPRFICILGERYGSIPPGKERSITESEIQYAVLDRLQVPEYRYFYFRDPQATASIPQNIALDIGYIESADPEEIKILGITHAELLARQRTEKLEKMKDAIGKAGFEPFIYPARWDEQDQRLAGLEAFGERVYSDLLASVEDEVGTGSVDPLDEFEQENEAMRTFIEERTDRYFIGSRRALLDQITAFAGSAEPPTTLLITGQPGLGKTSLLGKAYQQLTENHPGLIVIPHFIGATAGSTDLRLILRRLIHELSTEMGVQEQVPEDIKELLMSFPILLKKACESRRVVLFIDALNQLDPTHEAHLMNWLPAEDLPGVRIILSSLAHPALEALRSRRSSMQELELTQLERQDEVGIIAGFLERYGKQMNPEQVNLILAKQESSNPLYLLVALEELRTLGTYAEMTERIRALPGEVRPLFLWILRRLSDDPGFRDAHGRVDGAQLIRNFVSCLAASRHGLSQSELVEILSPGDPFGNVAALQRFLRPYLMRRGELFDFYHSQMRQAVEGEYLDEDHERVEAHHILADFFRRQADPLEDSTWTGNARGVSELPHHLGQAQLWASARTALTDLVFIDAKCLNGMTFDLLRDYCEILESLSEEREVRREAQAHAIKSSRYVENLMEFARGTNSTLEIISAEEPWSEKRIEDDSNRIKRTPSDLDQLKAFYQFVDSESHALIKFGQVPGFCLQQAYNSVRSGPVAEAAEKILASNKEKNILILHKPPRRREYNPHPGLIRSLRGHTGYIKCLSITPDGKTAVSGSKDETVRVWDIASGACLRVFSGHTSHVNDVSISADGKKVISCSFDNTIRLWDVVNGNCVRVLNTIAGGGEVSGVCMLPHGGLAISLEHEETKIRGQLLNSTLNMWDLEKATCLKSIPLGKGTTNVIDAPFCITPNGELAIVGLVGGMILVVNVKEGRSAGFLKGHTKTVICLRMTPDGKRAFSIGKDKTLRSWDLASHECLKTIDYSLSEPFGFDITPDGSNAIAVDHLFDVEVWNLGKEYHPKRLDIIFRMPWYITEADSAVCIAPDGSIAISGGEDFAISVWDVTRGCFAGENQEWNHGNVKDISISPDNKRALSSGESDLCHWDLESGEIIPQENEQVPQEIRSISISIDGKDPLSLWEWDPKQYGGRHALAWQSGIHQPFIPSQACVTQDGARAVTYHIGHEKVKEGEHLLDMWDLAKGRKIQALSGINRIYTHLEMLADGRRMVANSDVITQVFDLETGKMAWAAGGGKISVSPRGKRIGILKDGIIHIKQIGNYLWSRELTGYLSNVSTISYLPNGKTIIAGCKDGNIVMWDIERKNGWLRPVRGFQAHSGSVNWVIPAQDGKKVVSIGIDGAVRLWDIQTLACLGSYQALGIIVCVSRMTPDGQIVYGTQVGEIVPLSVHNLAFEPPLVTPFRMWLYGTDRTRGQWDIRVRATCPWCGKFFEVADEILDNVRKASRLPEQEDNPMLLSACPECQKIIRFNPFINDKRE